MSSFDFPVVMNDFFRHLGSNLRFVEVKDNEWTFFLRSIKLRARCLWLRDSPRWIVVGENKSLGCHIEYVIETCAKNLCDEGF